MRSPEAIYIGDETRDCEAAREAGIAFGAVAWGYATVETLAEMQPEMVFRTVEEIAECVEVNPGVGVHLEKGI